MNVTVYAASYEACPTNRKYRTEHRLGLSLLAHGLNDLYQLSFDEDSLSDKIQTNACGKPYLPGFPDIHFNISHTDQLAVCAFAPCEIGVDVELITDYPAVVIKKVFTDEEIRQLDALRDDETAGRILFYKFWTLKESFLKEKGKGFSMSPKSFSFRIDGDGTEIHCSTPDVYFAQDIIATDMSSALSQAENHYIISVCAAQPILKIDIQKIVFISRD